MKILISEKLSEHKYKTPEGYLICTDAILARTGKQIYTKDELFGDGDDTEVEVDRPFEQVMNEKTIASFENKPVTWDHPDEDVNVGNYKHYSIGYVRDVHQGKTSNGEDVILGNLIITDQDAINAIEEGSHTDLSCGYDCDIKDNGKGKYFQNNIRGNHVALCEQGRAGIARIVDSKAKEDILLGKKVIIRKRYSNLDGTIGTIYSYEGTNYDDKVEVERNGHIYKVNYEDIEFLDSKVKDANNLLETIDRLQEIANVTNYTIKEGKNKNNGHRIVQYIFDRNNLIVYDKDKDEIIALIENGKTKINKLHDAIIGNKIEDSKIAYNVLKELKYNIYKAISQNWETVFSDEFFYEDSFSLEQSYFDKNQLVVNFKPRKEAYFKWEYDFEKFKAGLKTIPDLKLKSIHKKSVSVRFDTTRFIQVDQIVFQYTGQMTDSMRDDYSIKEIKEAAMKLLKQKPFLTYEEALQKVKENIKNGNYLLDNKIEDAEYTYKLTKKKNDYDEYVIQAYKNGKKNEDATYYTDNWDDAINTLKSIAKQEKLTFRQQGSVFIADNKAKAFKDSKEMTMSDAIKMLNFVAAYKKVKDSYIVVRNKSDYENAARRLGLTIEKDIKNIRIYGNKDILKQLQKQFDNDEEISYSVIKDASKDKWVIKNTGLAYEVWNQGKMVKKFPAKKLAVEWIHSRFPNDEIIEDSINDGKIWNALIRKRK